MSMKLHLLVHLIGKKRQFPDQNSPLAATWEKKEPNYYRIDILERLFFSIVAPINKKMILEKLS